MKIIDRNSTTYEVLSPLAKDIKSIGLLLPKVVNVLGVYQMLNDKGFSYSSHSYTMDEQHLALLELLKIITRGNNIEFFDISMAKKVILHALGLDRPLMPPLPIIAALDRLGVLDRIIKENRKDGVTMKKEITTGIPIIDRNGVSHIAYSYLVTDFREAMELLQKIDTFNMLENHEEESYGAMLEIVYRALNKRYTKEELLKFIDAKFIQESIRVYYNLPQITP